MIDLTRFREACKREEPDKESLRKLDKLNNHMVKEIKASRDFYLRSKRIIEKNERTDKIIEKEIKKLGL